MEIAEIYDLPWETAQVKRFFQAKNQDPFAFRALSRARKLSAFLVAGGEVAFAPLPSDTPLDLWAGRQIERVLAYLKAHPGALERFRAPVCHEQARVLICDSLGLPLSTVIDHSHVRQAVLSALLFPLRQAVGSCFATAPAILIQAEQIERFLDDMFSLLVLGKMRRTFGGVQYAVPLNATWGSGNLKMPMTEAIIHSPAVEAAFGGAVPSVVGKTVGEFFHRTLKREEAKRAEAVYKSFADHALLRSWEYSLAAFCDYKTDFARWNLYTSLGLDKEEEGGLGEAIYNALGGTLDVWNEKIGRLSEEHNVAVDRARLSQTMLSRADTSEKARRLKGELDMNLHHLDTVRAEVEEAQAVAKEYAELYRFLMEFLQQQLEVYFQEVYDAERVEVGNYDDSPAGFRLVFKHGRDDPSQWDLIYNGEQFVEALASFFHLVEREAVHACPWETGKEEMRSLFETLISHVKTPRFLEKALERVKGKTPWSYISGGSMQQLLSGYYCHDGFFTEETRAVESALDLATFLLDLFKEARPELTEPFLRDPERSLLMYSPTHAFLLKPGFSLFAKGWQEKQLTYTWIRDQIIAPARHFYDAIILDKKGQKELSGRLGLAVALPGTVSLRAWREEAVACGAPPALVDAMVRFAFAGAPPFLLFADSNWCYYDLGFTYNPGTDAFELWRVHKNGHEGAPMCEWDEHLVGKEKWGVLLRPFEYGGLYTRPPEVPRYKV